MIKDNQKYFNQLHIVLDGLVVAVSYLLAWFLKFEGLFSDGSTLAHPPSFYFSALYFLVPGYLIIYYMNRMYAPKRSQRLETELATVFRANAIGVAAFMISITLFKVEDFSRGLIAIFAVTNTKK